MSLEILDATVETNCAGATSQQRWLTYLAAPWAGGNVTVRIYGTGDVLRDTLTLEPWTIDTVSDPRRLVCGTRAARTNASTGDITKIVFRTGSTDIFSYTAGTTGSGADVEFVGAIKALCNPNLDAVYVEAPGELPASILPTWRESMTAGTWAEIPVGVTLADINPCNDPALNPNYPSAPEWAVDATRFENVIKAWCGAAYDEDTDTMWLGLGGGHNDYAGNEIIKCTFNAEAPEFVLVRPPSGAIGNLLTTNDNLEESGIYSDGRPRATHTYNHWVYVPNVGPVISSQGATSWDVSGGKTWALFFDETDGEALFSTDHALFTYANASGIGCCYDANRHAIWITPRNNVGMVRYDIPTSGGVNTGSFTLTEASYAKYGQNSLCYLPLDDVIMHWSSTDGHTLTPLFTVYDCATGVRYTPTVSGSGALDANSAGEVQWRWVPSLGAAFAWNNTASRTLITRLTPGANPRTDTWTMDTLTVDGSNTVTPSAKVTNGTYGRFAYSSNLDGFIVFNATAGPYYFFARS